MGSGVSAFNGQELRGLSLQRKNLLPFSEWKEKHIKRLAKYSRVQAAYAPYLRDTLKKQDRLSKKQARGKTSRQKRMTVRRPPRLRRSNSSNSFFVSSTMLHLDHYALLICVSAAMHCRFKEWIPNTRRQPHLACFVDRKPPRPNGRPPSVTDFRAFLTFIYRTAQLEPEGLILGLVYYERILKAFEGALRVCRVTWRPLVLCSLIMASKMFDDLSMINKDFETVCRGEFSLQQINEMELTVALLLRFDLNINVSEYAKYYFNLRSMLGTDIVLAAKAPLALNSALRMSTLTGTYEDIKNIESLSRCRQRRTRTYADDGEMFLDVGRPINLEQISWHGGLPSM